jgi:hypothetical protein
MMPMNAERKTCTFCKGPFEGITHRCLSGPLAVIEEGTDYERGFADGWAMAVSFRPWWPSPKSAGV